MGVPMIGLDLLASAIGIVVTGYYALGRCDPIANKDVDNTNQVI